MNVSINNEKEMLLYAKSVKYITIFPDKTMKHYPSLRKISEDICVDHTTISKKLAEENPCICQSQNGGYLFLIRKL